MPPAGGIFHFGDHPDMATEAALPYNRGMNQLDLLLPFGLPPQEMARDLLRELKTPALAMLLARANRTAHHVSDDFARALPHERWLAQQFGLPPSTTNSSPALATALMTSFGLPAQPGNWFVVQPVHLHVAMDHIVLTEPRQLQLTEQDARALFALAQPLFEESGATLLYGDANIWFLRRDEWSDFQTSTPDAVSGHNIDIWMPKGAKARDWRRLQNEIQMHWHAHALNEQREMNGLKPVNSLWLWGGTNTTEPAGPSTIDETFSLRDSATPYVQLGEKRQTADSANTLLQSSSQRGLLLLDTLIEPALSGDWSQWLGAMHQFEATWFAPLLDAIRNGQLPQLSITISHNTALSTYAISKTSLRKFWQKASLSRLAS